MRIKNTRSHFKNILSSILRSIVGPILYSIFLNEFSFFTQYFVKFRKINSLAKILELEGNCAFDLFDRNKIIANPDKFDTFLLDKRKTDLTDKV